MDPLCSATFSKHARTRRIPVHRTWFNAVDRALLQRRGAATECRSGTAKVRRIEAGGERAAERLQHRSAASKLSSVLEQARQTERGTKLERLRALLRRDAD